MPTLIAFVIRHFTNGFLLGAAAALAGVLIDPASMAARLATESAAGLLLIMFSLGLPFGMGSLATALWFEAVDG